MILVLVEKTETYDGEEVIVGASTHKFDSLSDAESWVHHVAWSPNESVEIYDATLIRHSPAKGASK